VSVVPAQSVVEGAGSITIDLLQGVTDVDSTLELASDSLQIKLGNTVLSLAQNSDAFTLSGHTLTINPTASVFDKLGAVTENLQLSWSVKEQLGTGMNVSVARQATVAVQGVNDAPVLLKQVNQSVTEDTASFSVDLLGSSLVRDVDTAKSALTVSMMRLHSVR
jgi:VCBS repeat-containing protein